MRYELGRVVINTNAAAAPLSVACGLAGSDHHQNRHDARRRDQPFGAACQTAILRQNRTTDLSAGLDYGEGVIRAGGTEML